MRTTDFSDHYALGETTKEAIDSVSTELKTATWNVIARFTNATWDSFRGIHFENPIFVHTLAEFFNVTDEQVTHVSANDYWSFLKPKFFALEGRKFYDLLNFLSKRVRDQAKIIATGGYKSFAEVMNFVLQEKGAPCEFIEYGLTLKLEPQEQEALDKSMNTPYTKVNKSIRDAASLLYEGKWEDSAKKSIDAVEALLKNILQEDHIDFDKAIDKIGSTYNIHKGLIRAQKSFWGYASQCARHQTTDSYPYSPTNEDAKFVLIWSGSFIDLLLSKTKT